MQKITKPAAGRRKHDKKTKKNSGADAGSGPFGGLRGSDRNDDIRTVSGVCGDRFGDGKCDYPECEKHTGDDGSVVKKLVWRGGVTVVSETTGSDGKSV